MYASGAVYVVATLMHIYATDFRTTKELILGNMVEKTLMWKKIPFRQGLTTKIFRPSNSVAAPNGSSQQFHHVIYDANHQEIENENRDTVIAHKNVKGEDLTSFGSRGPSGRSTDSELPFRHDRGKDKKGVDKNQDGTQSASLLQLVEGKVLS